MRIACSAILLSLLAAGASAQTLIVADDFNTQGTPQGGDRLYIAGTNPMSYANNHAPLDVNLPGGKWTKVAGWNWGDPFIPASWDGGPKDFLNFGEDVTGIAISLAGYNTGNLHISAQLSHISSNNAGSVGLGFYSSLGPKNTGGGAFNLFTGVVLTENSALSSSLQVYVNGTPTGPAVETGAFVENQYYTIAYDINTATGELSNVTLDGVAIALTSSAFTADLLQYGAGVQSGGQNGRASMDNFAISAIPEPATGVAGVLLATFLLRRRSRHNQAERHLV